MNKISTLIIALLVFSVFLFLINYVSEAPAEQPPEEKDTNAGIYRTDKNALTCPEGSFLRGQADCWESKDAHWCNLRSREWSGCCDGNGQCWDSKKCVDSGYIPSEYPYLLCFEGKWDFCLAEDLCQKRGSYYCSGVGGIFWVKEKPEQCKFDWNKPEDGLCPDGGFYRGEWDCWEKEDDENCGSADASHGCCSTGGQCWFNNSCYSSDSPLSESSEWLCYLGKWDRCLEKDECVKHGSYYCRSQIWVRGEPEGCEIRDFGEDAAAENARDINSGN